MNATLRLKYLQMALVAIGITFIAGIYLLMIVWPSGWTWHTGHSDYPLMIIGIYATLGVFLIMAARNPMAHLSLIWFTVQPGAWRNHGCPVVHRSHESRSSPGRRSRAFHRGSRACAFDSTGREIAIHSLTIRWLSRT